MRAFLNIDCDYTELTDSVVYSTEVIQECYEAIDEGADDPTFIDTAQKYTKSLLVTVLEFAYKILGRMIAQLLKAFNSYIINDVRIANKYKKFILSRADKLDDPIHYDYYSYEGLYEFPRAIQKSDVDTATIIAKMEQLSKNKAPGEQTIDDLVNSSIISFSKDVLGDKVNPDDLTASVEKIVKHNVRGRKTRISITRSNIEEFYRDMENTVKERKKVNVIKAQINEYYVLLKNEINNAYKEDKKPRNPGNPNFRDADVKIHNINGNVTKFELQRNRLLNAYIQIYRTAFTKKIDILNEKIRLDAGLIAELCKRTSVFTHVLPRSSTK